MVKKQEIPTADLGKILDSFDLGKITGIKPVDTSGNMAYIIKSIGKKYFLRLAPHGQRWRSKKEILAEIELVDYLADRGFPVASAIASKDGEPVISWKKHFGYMREYTDGSAKLNPDLREIYQFGAQLGIFHKLVENYKTVNRRSHAWGLKETRNNFNSDKKLILRSSLKNKKIFIEDFEREIFSLCLPDCLPEGTIHEDLGKRHVIWKKNKIVGFIDFDRSYYGKLVLDLGQACRGWCFTKNWKNWNNDKFKALIDGYVEKRKLAEIEKKYLTDAIKFAILERGLSFCLRYILVTGNPEDAKYARYSVSNDGLIEMIERNKEKIGKIIKAA